MRGCRDKKPNFVVAIKTTTNEPINSLQLKKKAFGRIEQLGR